jgi:ABC-type polysaccharide/polyol phosphate export permease
VLALNPLSGLIEMFRYAVVPSQPVHWDFLSLSLGTTALAALFGLMYFKRAERAFADIV